MDRQEDGLFMSDVSLKGLIVEEYQILLSSEGQVGFMACFSCFLGVEGCILRRY